MDFTKFVSKAIQHDKRNTFSRYNGSLDGIPDILKIFYRENNPVDVEINGVRFLPIEECRGAQSEYSYLNTQFIFATSNGDPIFLHNGCVYCAPHGVNNPEWEFLSDDFFAYLEQI